MHDQDCLRSFLLSLNLYMQVACSNSLHLLQLGFAFFTATCSYIFLFSHLHANISHVNIGYPVLLFRICWAIFLSVFNLHVPTGPDFLLTMVDVLLYLFFGLHGNATRAAVQPYELL